jgi:hypothetical protein
VRAAKSGGWRKDLPETQVARILVGQHRQVHSEVGADIVMESIHSFH